MKRLVAFAAALTALVCVLPGQPSAADGPEYAADGQLRRPANYREWVFLSAGLGMTYGPAAQNTPAFDNVFVNRQAYAAFLKTGAWPDKTIFVLEIRAAQSEGSINKGGNFQADFRAMETHVKEGGKWAFYGFGAGKDTAAKTPETATCYSCHQQNGAVDTTFVQFYPTLIQLAKDKGTYKQ